jgi:hypothetical protein
VEARHAQNRCLSSPQDKRNFGCTIDPVVPSNLIAPVHGVKRFRRGMDRVALFLSVIQMA